MKNIYTVLILTLFMSSFLSSCGENIKEDKIPKLLKTTQEESASQNIQTSLSVSETESIVNQLKEQYKDELEAVGLKLKYRLINDSKIQVISSSQRDNLFKLFIPVGLSYDILKNELCLELDRALDLSTKPNSTDCLKENEY